jgi:hypothetical protein
LSRTLSFRSDRLLASSIAAVQNLNTCRLKRFKLMD